MLVGSHFRESLVNYYFRQLNVTTSDSFYGLESCSDKIHGQVKFIMTKSRVQSSQTLSTWNLSTPQLCNLEFRILQFYIVLDR